MAGESFHRFGPFLIVRELGRGGMGEVFLARTPWAEHPLAAVKRLRPDVARIPTFVERFRHEAALAVRLSHPNLVATLDVGAVDEKLYVAAELILGKDVGYVADRLRMRSQGGPAAVALRLMLDGLAGLAYVHGATEEDGSPLELVHRDVTPGNLLIGYDGRARLADFGLAKSHLSEGNRLTKQGEILGTPHYLAPEVVKGAAGSSASDIYGLGAVIYRFLTGIAPYQGGTSEVLMKVLTERPRPLQQLRPDLPRWLVELFERMLLPDPRQRPTDARLLAERAFDRAKAEGILVPRAAVGRWLAQLFEDEHQREMEEHARLTLLDPSQIEPPKEGTVVLARAVDEKARLFGPDPLLTSMSEDDGHGTELELAASAVLGMSPPVEDDLAEMPTRAVEAVASSPSRSPSGAHEADHDTDIEQFRARRRALSLDEAEPEALEAEDDNETLDAEALPGFVDAPEGRPISGRSAAVSRSFTPKSRAPLEDPPPVPEPSRPSGLRSLSPELADRQLDTPPVGERLSAEWAGPPSSGAPASPRPLRSGATREHSDPLLVTPVEDGSPQRALPRSVEALADPKAPPVGFRRSILFLAGLLSLAVALGIGLGKVVARLRASTEPIAAPIRILEDRPPKERLDALNLRLEALREEGRDPASAWRLAAGAASALLEGDEEAAERYLAEAEALVGP